MTTFLLGTGLFGMNASSRDCSTSTRLDTGFSLYSWVCDFSDLQVSEFTFEIFVSLLVFLFEIRLESHQVLFEIQEASKVLLMKSFGFILGLRLFRILLGNN